MPRVHRLELIVRALEGDDEDACLQVGQAFRYRTDVPVKLVEAFNNRSTLRDGQLRELSELFFLSTLGLLQDVDLKDLSKP